MKIHPWAGKLIFFVLIVSEILLSACTQRHSNNQVGKSNQLNRESSPYLLQHAQNPVHWQAWNQEALQLARENNSLILVSIGYSSCHWCHVMEKECFEDLATAALMNAHYVSIKVDREERPDVDQIYMTALQLMSGQGGWPLNVVCLPDGRPVWGATYLPKDQWNKALTQLAEIYASDPDKMEEYAQKLQEGIRQAELVETRYEISEFDEQDARKIFNYQAQRFDSIDGGSSRAPKFPMPVNLQFLLEYGHLDNNARALDHVKLSLDKMAAGGIYDQLGGGFARYATDALWKVPHFEKMLYDNAQLVSLYAQAFRKFKEPEYLRVLRECLDWLNTEMRGNKGAYYAAIDADSEGEEGKFYVWNEQELKSVIPESEWEAFSAYFDLEHGLWEGDKIILIRSGQEVDPEQLKKWRYQLYHLRKKRPEPGLDDKNLTSWNALMISGLIEAAKAFGSTDPEYASGIIENAIVTAKWISQEQSFAGNQLYHTSRLGKAGIEGLLEDYAFSIQAFLDLFEYTGERHFLDQSLEWLAVLNENFRDEDSELFFTRSLRSEQLISPSLDRVDNVIPSPNSVMAHNLWRFSHLIGDEALEKRALKMLNHVERDRLLEFGDSYANWARLVLRFGFKSPEIVIAGAKSSEYYQEIQNHFIPNSLHLWSTSKSDLPLLQGRLIEGQTTIYICENKVCQLPVTRVDEALIQLVNPM